MSVRDEACKACGGSGMLADDEGWQYVCSVCHGTGKEEESDVKPVRILAVDENNRLLD